MVTQDTIRRRVNRGVRLLNKAKPGWHNLINLNRLDTNMPAHCVLGQLYGEDYIGLKELGLSYRKDHKYGFNSVLGQFDNDMPRLDATWKRAIKQLRKA